jgi:hypothetical protein
MSDTVLEHPLVREYLRELDKASLTLPAAQARELREQIAAHLDEALPPGAATEEVAAELSRLGSPRSLAADAAGPGRRTFVRRRLGRVRWWAWVAIAALVALAGSALTYALLALSATMVQGPVGNWYFPQDQARTAVTESVLGMQFTAPQRFGQQQGIEISVFNNSDWTQTVVGPDPNWLPFGASSVQVAVGSGPTANRGDSIDGPIDWSPSGSIPPHSFRLLRVVWNTGLCLDAGLLTSIQQVVLTVRVGIFTRTQTIPTGEVWTLAGASYPACH